MKLERAKTVVCVVDMQERLFQAMDREVARDVARNVAILVKGAKFLGVPVLCTQQYTKGLGETIAEVRAELDRPAIEKVTFSCCGTDAFNTALMGLGAKQVVLAGMETHVCVLQTALDLLARGYGVHVAVDAVMSRRKLAWETGLRHMEKAGAVMTLVETVLYQLLGRAGTDEFKAILSLVR